MLSVRLYAVGLGLLALSAHAGAQTAAFPPAPSASPPPSQPTPPPSQSTLPPPYNVNPATPPYSYPPRALPQQIPYASPAARAPTLAPQVGASAQAGVSPASYGYVLQTTRNTGLLWAGGLTFGGGYLGALGYATSASVGSGGGWLAVPVIGPWIAINGRHFRCEKSEQLSQAAIDDCLSAAARELKTVTVLTFSGLFQVVGATLLIVGWTDKQQQWLPPDMSVDAGPVGASGQGLLVHGTF